MFIGIVKEKFENIKGLMGSRRSKDRQYNGKRTRGSSDFSYTSLRSMFNEV